MTMPSGLLMWGQAGAFNAVDDRLVITALANGRTGLIRGGTLTAGSGLQVSLAAGWLGIANAGDGTSAVVGSRSPVTFTVPAGGSAARTDCLWCDVSPDQATWTLALLSPSQLPGRAGILIASINIPANANLSSQFGMIPAGTGFGNSSTIVTTAGGLAIAGTMPSGNPRTVFSRPAGQPGAQTNYLIRMHLFGDILNRSGVIQMTVGFPGGLDRIALTAEQSYGRNAAQTSQEYGSNPAQFGPFPADYWRLWIEGQIRVNAWAGLSQSPNFTVACNTSAGATLQIFEGSSLEMLMLDANYAA